MKIFPLTPLEWMISINLIYLIIGFADIHYHWWPVELVQPVWILILSLPLWIPMPWLMRGSPFWKQ